MGNVRIRHDRVPLAMMSPGDMYGTHSIDGSHSPINSRNNHYYTKAVVNQANLDEKIDIRRANKSSLQQSAITFDSAVSPKSVGRMQPLRAATMMRQTNLVINKPSVFQDNARKASLDVNARNNGLDPNMTEPKAIARHLGNLNLGESAFRLP